MNDQNSRVIPPGQFGSPFFEPSLSMGASDSGVLVHRRGGFDVSGSMNGDNAPDLSRFFDMNNRGGTDFASALALVSDELPRDDRWNRYQIVITDGDVFDGDEVARKAHLGSLLAGLGDLRFCCIGCMDDVPDIYTGAFVVPDRPAADLFAELVASLKPGEQLVCLDYSGAQPPFPGDDAPRVIASRPADDDKSS